MTLPKRVPVSVALVVLSVLTACSSEPAPAATAVSAGAGSSWTPEPLLPGLQADQAPAPRLVPAEGELDPVPVGQAGADRGPAGAGTTAAAAPSSPEGSAAAAGTAPPPAAPAVTAAPSRSAGPVHHVTGLLTGREQDVSDGSNACSRAEFQVGQRVVIAVGSAVAQGSLTRCTPQTTAERWNTGGSDYRRAVPVFEIDVRGVPEGAGYQVRTGAQQWSVTRAKLEGAGWRLYLPEGGVTEIVTPEEKAKRDGQLFCEQSGTC